MTFRQWENKVNERMLQEHGVGVDDIPDMPWYDWFTDEMEVETAVQEAIDTVNNGLWI